MFFVKEYQPNSHAGSYTILIFIFIYYLSWPAAWSRSRNFDIPAPAPAPAKSSGSLWLRLHNTYFYTGNIYFNLSIMPKSGERQINP